MQKLVKLPIFHYNHIPSLFRNFRLKNNILLYNYNDSKTIIIGNGKYIKSLNSIKTDLDLNVKLYNNKYKIVEKCTYEESIYINYNLEIYTLYGITSFLTEKINLLYKLDDYKNNIPSNFFQFCSDNIQREIEYINKIVKDKNEY